MDIKIVKNEEVSLELLEEVLKFDQSIFDPNGEYSLPDGYLTSVYNDHKEGMFVLLNEDKVIGYVNVLFMSDERYYEYLESRDYLSLKNEGIHYGENNMYFYTLAISPEYRDQGYILLLLKSLFTWLQGEINNGKTLKNVISEVMFEDGVKPALKMGFERMDSKRLGMYYSKDCLNEYMHNLLGKNN